MGSGLFEAIAFLLYVLLFLDEALAEETLPSICAAVLVVCAFGLWSGAAPYNAPIPEQPLFSRETI